MALLLNANDTVSRSYSYTIPSPNHVSEVQAVGDYDSETGMYKIPVVTSADGAEPITTPIYLPTPLYSGEVLRSDGSRDVKRGKLVLTGEETWKLQSVNDYGIYNFYTEFTIPMNVISGLCNNFKPQNSLISDTKDVGFLLSKQATSTILYIRADNRIATDVNAFKSWLAAKYAAGTPVTVWYRLAAPTTETFTAPQIPTLNGTTVIDVDTAVKPTEMYTKYKSSK